MRGPFFRSPPPPPSALTRITGASPHSPRVLSYDKIPQTASLLHSEFPTLFHLSIKGQTVAFEASSPGVVFHISHHALPRLVCPEQLVSVHFLEPRQELPQRVFAFAALPGTACSANTCVTRSLAFCPSLLGTSLRRGAAGS